MKWSGCNGGWIATPESPVDIPGCTILCEVWHGSGSWQAGVSVFVHGETAGMWATAVADADEGRAWAESNWRERSVEVLQRFVLSGQEVRGRDVTPRDTAAKGICGFSIAFLSVDDAVTLPDIFVSAEEMAFSRTHLSRRRLAEKVRTMRWQGWWKASQGLPSRCPSAHGQ